MLTYTVELKPQEEGGYTATVPALPGCISEGDTVEESLENIRDAAEGYLKTLAKHQRKIPMEFSDFRQVDRVSGSHYILYKDDHSLPISVPFHNKDLKTGTLSSIVKQAKLSRQEFIDLL